MAAAESRRHKRWRLCPLWTQNLRDHRNGGAVSSITRSSSVSSVARSILPARRRLRLDPSKNLYFPYEAGKQVRSAVWIKNSSKSHVAFKFQTTAPKSCYMRPPGGILAPGESLIATVFKFVEHPENNEKPINQKSRVKFKMMSLKVREGTDYVPELVSEMPTSNVVYESFDDEGQCKHKRLGTHNNRIVAELMNVAYLACCDIWNFLGFTALIYFLFFYSIFICVGL